MAGLAKQIPHIKSNSYLYCKPLMLMMGILVLPGVSRAETATYTYDALNRLTTATINGSRIEYEYDSAGNILSVTTPFAVAVTKSGDGTGSVSDNFGKLSCGDDCSGVYDSGTEVVLAASADLGSAFDHWEGACVGTGACQVTVSAIENVEAVFSLSPLSADLVVTKTDGATSVVPGEATTYTIQVQNNGPDDVIDAIFLDAFPATLDCDFSSVASGGASGSTASGAGNISDTLQLPSGASVTYTAVCDIAPDAIGVLSNTASIASAIGDPSPGNESATDTSSLTPTGDLAITKTDGVTSVNPGETVTYSIAVTNSGPSKITGATVIDTFPAGLTCIYASSSTGGATGNSSVGSGNINNSLSLPVGAIVNYSAQCTIDDTANGLISNTATISSIDGDPNPSNNSATDATTVNASADLSITKTNGLSTVNPGVSTTYTIVVANDGPSAVTGASLSDTLPPGIDCTFTSIASGGTTGNSPSGTGDIAETLNFPAGGSITYIVPCQIQSSANGTLSNTATISSGLPDPSPGNESSTDEDTLVPLADLYVQAGHSGSTIEPGGSITYTIEVGNTGPSDAVEATLVDNFPAVLTCTYSSVASGGATGNEVAGSGDISDSIVLPAGAKVVYTANCDIDEQATGTLSNTATVTTTISDPSTGNESATENVDLEASADLVITKTDGKTVATAGGSTTYTIIVTNNGPSAVDDAQVTDNFPAELTCAYTSIAAGGATGNTASSSGDISDTLSLPAGSSVTYTVPCDIDEAATGTLINTATVSSSVSDPSPGDESATDQDDLQIIVEVIYEDGFESE